MARGLHPLRDLLIVMSTADNTSGLILASSPKAKEVLGVRNVARKWDLPTPEENPAMNKLIVAPPRMRYYISENLKIQNIVRNYATDEDIMWYSIDEGVVDLSRSLNYFVPDKNLSRARKLDIVSQMIQRDILRATGIYSTVGMSNSNPLLAKLALDNEAKKNHNMRALWNYEDVTTKVWSIPEMDDFWGIGSRMKRNLEQMNIKTIQELANASPERLHRKFGVMGMQLYHHANGIDRSKLQKPYIPKGKNIGNSQVLPRDYAGYEMPLLIREMAEQVAIRLRRRGAKTTTVHLFVGYSKDEEKRGFGRQMKVPATNDTQQLADHLLFLFNKFYDGRGFLRHIGVTYSDLVYDGGDQLNLFEDPAEQEKRIKIDQVTDKIREKYGFVSIVRASSTLENGRSIKRAGLVGGHNGGAGGLDGL
ncbi:DNA polymerase V [Enterococcus sp. AZ007]